MDWRSIQFDWNHARAFLVTAEEGSFSAAARALNTTQPTVGRQVTALEEELGVLLFERTTRGLELTSSGCDLLEQVSAMGDAANRFSLVASGRAEAIEGSICITASEVMAAFILPPILEKLRQQAPGIEVELIASNSISDLMRREADIAIRAFRPTEPDLIAKKACDLNAHLYASKNYLEQFKTRASPHDLSQADFLAFDGSDQLIVALNEHGFNLTSRNFPVIVKSHLVQWELVKQGVGIGFMIEDIGDQESLVERALPGFKAFPVETWIVVHRELRTSRRLRIVFDFLASELARAC